MTNVLSNVYVSDKNKTVSADQDNNFQHREQHQDETKTVKIVPRCLEIKTVTLQLRTKTVVASDQVHVLGVTQQARCQCLRRASTGFTSLDGSDIHLTQSQQLHWSKVL